MFEENDLLKILINYNFSNLYRGEKNVSSFLEEHFNQYICDNFTYDLQYRYFNMLDFLNAKSGVCHHFAKLFDDLCHICGIECKYITGRSVQDGHAWNSVNLNGQTLYVDTTWNLTGWDDETYLLLDESTFNLSHGNYKINFEK